MSYRAGPAASAVTDATGRDSRLMSRAGAVALLLLGGVAIFTFWYRSVYNVLPGQGASGRVHWCGRDYEDAGPPLTYKQAQAQAGFPLQAEGGYPPLALSRDALLAAAFPPGREPSASCATLVFLRTGPDAYRPYALEGGP